MKAVLTDERFSDPGWIFERKLDGIRCIAEKDGDGVRLRSRNDLDLNRRFPEVARALEADPVSDVLLDGEVVAFDGAQTSFARLQQRGARPVAVFYYVFDLLRIGGEDVTGSRCARARRGCARRSRSAIRSACPRIATGRRGVLRRGLPEGLGGAHRQARGRPVHARALARLAQVQVLGRAGARDRRLHRAARQPDRSRRAAARLLRRWRAALRRQGRDRVHARDAARARRPLAPLRRDASPFADEVRERDGDVGRAASSSPRSASASGPATGACAIRASWGCATTRRRARSCASRAEARRRLKRPGCLPTNGTRCLLTRPSWTA